MEVTDTGIGMDEATRRRCLEPFFTPKGERGTGLGLAMVYGTMQRHGADIDIESALGQGTTVRLSFAVPAVVTGAREATTAYTVPGPLRILVVDDDPLLLKSLRDALERSGHEIVTAADGRRKRPSGPRGSGPQQAAEVARAQRGAGPVLSGCGVLSEPSR